MAISAHAWREKTRNRQKLAPKTTYFRQNSTTYRSWGMLNPNMTLVFKPEVVLGPFLRMRSEKNAKTAQNDVLSLNSLHIWVIGHA